ncbi:unnamed protein product [Cochlearia groenlandica]
MNQFSETPLILVVATYVLKAFDVIHWVFLGLNRITVFEKDTIAIILSCNKIRNLLLHLCDRNVLVGLLILHILPIVLPSDDINRPTVSVELRIVTHVDFSSSISTVGTFNSF